MIYVNCQKLERSAQKNALEVQDLKNYNRTTKMWNHFKSMEKMGGHIKDNVEWLRTLLAKLSPQENPFNASNGLKTILDSKSPKKNLPLKVPSFFFHSKSTEIDDKLYTDPLQIKLCLCICYSGKTKNDGVVYLQ
jgi:hypothetical protein